MSELLAVTSVLKQLSLHKLDNYQIIITTSAWNFKNEQVVLKINILNLVWFFLINNK